LENFSLTVRVVGRIHFSERVHNASWPRGQPM
jgi:hypothetical protein